MSKKVSWKIDVTPSKNSTTKLNVSPSLCAAPPESTLWNLIVNSMKSVGEKLMFSNSITTSSLDGVSDE